MGDAKCIARVYEEDVISERQSDPFNDARWQFPQSVRKKMLRPKIKNAEKIALKIMFFILILFPISCFHFLLALKNSM